MCAGIYITMQLVSASYCMSTPVTQTPQVFVRHFLFCSVVTRTPQATSSGRSCCLKKKPVLLCVSEAKQGGSHHRSSGEVGPESSRANTQPLNETDRMLVTHLKCMKILAALRHSSSWRTNLHLFSLLKGQCGMNFVVFYLPQGRALRSYWSDGWLLQLWSLSVASAPLLPFINFLSRISRSCIFW